MPFMMVLIDLCNTYCVSTVHTQFMFVKVHFMYFILTKRYKCVAIQATTNEFYHALYRFYILGAIELSHTILDSIMHQIKTIIHQNEFYHVL